MLWVVIRRAAVALPLLVVVALAAFSLSLLLPGDPAVAILGPEATPEQLQQVRRDLHLDLAPALRFARWASDVARGDLGRSALTRRPVSAEIARRLPVTAALTALSLVLALSLGLVLGTVQGLWAGGSIDRVLLAVISIGLATPGFWLATLLVSLFSVQLGWLPALGYVPLRESPLGWLRHAVLPVVALSLVGVAETARQVRTGLVDVLQRDYVRAAASRGFSPLRVVGRHALKNAAAPALTVMGLRTGHLLAGSLIIEQIFQIPGMGSYSLTAIQRQDLPVIQAVVLLSAAIVIAINLLVDIAYAALNPRVRVN
jgi:peptide/nickel transport system permease protein